MKETAWSFPFCQSEIQCDHSSIAYDPAFKLQVSLCDRTELRITTQLWNGQLQAFRRSWGEVHLGRVLAAYVADNTSF